jgi:hypothetical protein
MVVAAVAVNVIPGVGQVLSAAMITAITSAGVAAGLGMASSMLGLGPKAPKVSDANRDRLLASVDTTTPRKIVFGHTAMPLDIRHQEWTAIDGEAQGVLHQILFNASHRLTSIDEIWFEDRQAWTAAGGVNSYYIDSTGDHVGPYLFVDTVLEGSATNTLTIGDGSKWGSTRRCTGIGYTHLGFRVVATNPKDPMASPFSGGVPTRITIVGDGAPMYDPRQDSTAGGSGTMRANDQATWAFTGVGGEIGRNPALQILWYLLGWRINGKLALGRGIPPSRIDMASFITAANICDETVTSSVNGSEPRYRSDGVFSENDDPNMVLDTLKACCNGDLRDTGGVFSLHILTNDLADVAVQLSERDVLGAFVWKQTPDIEQTFNIVRGRFSDASNVSLYNLNDYPEVAIDSLDGIDRVDPNDYPTVQSVSQCQRLAKQRLERNLYRGTFAADFNARAWSASVGRVVELSFSPLGWANKKFRVLEMGIRVDGVCPLVLQEENANIYLWDNSDVPAVAPFEPTFYDPANAPTRKLLDTIDVGATRNVWRGPWAAGVLYLVGDLVLVDSIVYECIVEHTSVAGSPPPNANWQLWFATGAEDGLSAQITNPGITVPATWDGIVAPADYAGAQGEWQVYAGATDVTDQFLPIVEVANPGTLDTNYVGRSYAVVGSFDPEDDYADLTMQVNGTGSFAGVQFERTFRITKLRAQFPVDHDAPPQPTGLVLSDRIATQPDGSQQATLVATWDASPAADLAYYQLNVRQAGGNFVQFVVGGTRWEGPAIAGATYEAQLQAVDTSGNVSTTYPTPPGVVSRTVAGDATAPGVPTGFAAAATFQNVFLNWTNPADTDLSAVEVWENTANDSATATRIDTVGAVAGQPGTYTRPLATGQQRYYWLKAVDTSGNRSAFTASATATTAKIDATNELVAGSVTTNLITVNSLNGDRIQTATLTANKLYVSGNGTNDALPTGITVGVGGTTIGAVDTRAADPLAQANTQSTKLAPGLVLISGATTLASWRNGSDNTKIEGGAIAANTVAANVVQVGLRGVQIAGIEFEHNKPSANQVSWTAGTINYVNDSGTATSAAISAGSATWSSGTLYLYWVKGAGTISSTTNLATANSANNVVLAQYRGNVDLVANYGRTIVDGSDIKTGTVTANQMATGYLEATWATISVLRTATSGARLEIDTSQVRVYDSSNVLRVRMGVW